MSRPLRIEYQDAWYHVMNRGRRAETIFSDKWNSTSYILWYYDAISIKIIFLWHKKNYTIT